MIFSPKLDNVSNSDYVLGVPLDICLFIQDDLFRKNFKSHSLGRALCKKFPFSLVDRKCPNSYARVVFKALRHDIHIIL